MSTPIFHIAPIAAYASSQMSTPATQVPSVEPRDSTASENPTGSAQLLAAIEGIAAYHRLLGRHRHTDYAALKSRFGSQMDDKSREIEALLVQTRAVVARHCQTAGLILSQATGASASPIFVSEEPFAVDGDIYTVVIAQDGSMIATCNHTLWKSWPALLTQENPPSSAENEPGIAEEAHALLYANARLFSIRA